MEKLNAKAQRTQRAMCLINIKRERPGDYLAWIFVFPVIICSFFAEEVKAATVEAECMAYKIRVGEKKVDINAVTEKELIDLPGVGIKTARAIVDHRKAIGGFKSLEQLRRVRGVGNEVFDCLKDIVIVK